MTIEDDLKRIKSISRGSWLTGGGGKPVESSNTTPQVPRKNYLTLHPLPADDEEEKRQKEQSKKITPP